MPGKTSHGVGVPLGKNYSSTTFSSPWAWDNIEDEADLWSGAVKKIQEEAALWCVGGNKIIPVILHDLGLVPKNIEKWTMPWVSNKSTAAIPCGVGVWVGTYYPIRPSYDLSSGYGFGLGTKDSKDGGDDAVSVGNKAWSNSTMVLCLEKINITHPLWFCWVQITQYDLLMTWALDLGWSKKNSTKNLLWCLGWEKYQEGDAHVGALPNCGENITMTSVLLLGLGWRGKKEQQAFNIGVWVGKDMKRR